MWVLNPGHGFFADLLKDQARKMDPGTKNLSTSYFKKHFFVLGLFRSKNRKEQYIKYEIFCGSSTDQN